MKPRGQLMIEHRLIEKMLKVVELEVARIEKEKDVNPVFIDTAVDFIRTYADRTHHGKEEEILFKELMNKTLRPRDEEMMRELVNEHQYTRETVVLLLKAKDALTHGEKEAVSLIIEKLSILIRFYPEHIRKEDTVFFPNTEEYFTDAEIGSMLEKFGEFDKKMIHEKYQKLVEELKSY